MEAVTPGVVPRHTHTRSRGWYGIVVVKAIDQGNLLELCLVRLRILGLVHSMKVRNRTKSFKGGSPKTIVKWHR